ncbi:MAG TPA: L-threonylcarbamoyladenylate synthase [Candidatus Eisenbacteria bacterium]|nr:L-threonylcarbamoyladenylate synthase [Candidatus Eisenbacteria bacterium]
MPADVRPVDPAHPDRRIVAEAAEAILRGGVISFPTDTFYGLGCSLMDPAAVDMLYRLKRRPQNLAVISLISDPAEVEALAADIPDVAATLMKRFWPGPLSIVFRASILVPAACRGPKETIALRFPQHPLSLALVRALGGPLVASSANLSGQPPAKSAEEVIRAFGNQLDLVLDGGPSQAVQPSTLIDVTSGRVEVLRAGAVDVLPYVSRRA